MSTDYDRHQVPATGGGSFVNHGPFERLPAQELAEAAPGTCRMFDVDSVLLPCVKGQGDHWKVLSRAGIPTRLLAGHRSAPRGRVVEE